VLYIPAITWILNLRLTALEVVASYIYILFHEILKTFPNNVTLFMHKQYLEIFRTYQHSRSKLKTCEKLDVFLITYLHWWCNVINTKKYSNKQSNISYLLYIHNITSLEEKVWIQTFCNKSLFQLITILSKSRENISSTIIFTFNMFYNQIVYLQH
jgi:uncharacterized protein YhhL (DUF1145 family)